MANTQAIATSFKTELLTGHHALGTTVTRGATTADVIRAALFLASATINAATTTYSTTGEVTGSGYTAGGVTVTNANAPAATGTTAFWTPSASLSWTTVTLSTAFDCVLLYNSTQGNRAIAAYTFGSQTVTAGNFTLTMPTNDATTGLLRLA
jgi:hypothetical protein